MNILVTGGAGYIGSITCVRLIEAGYTPVILDNFCNSKPSVVDRIAGVAGARPALIEGDIRDRALLDRTLAAYKIDAVIHFAGLKAVGESVVKPLAYYENNLGGTFTLLQALDAAGVRTLIFSSSATVYGDPARVPILEGFPTGATNPYGRTKLMTEEILRDLHGADPRWNVILLRYFNPVGAHASGQIGEDPNGIPNNLMPYVAQVAIGKLPELSVFGNDYPTPDGTGVRDYIHVVDLALGHLRALEKLQDHPGVAVYNLGTGRGYSVLEMVAAFTLASGKQIPYRITNRRAGDIAQCYADPALARRELGWQARFGIEAMCADTWRWQTANPQGYK